MANTPNLALPELAAAQAQKHVTVNEALAALDGLTMGAVISATLTAPPATPADGDRYIVGAAATGAWAGWDGSIAHFTGGAWVRRTPKTGWRIWDVGASTLLVWTGAAWVTLDAAMGLMVASSATTVAIGADGSNVTIHNVEELLALSGASVSSAATIPDRAIVLAVSTRTVTAIAGATSYDCGIAGTVGKFGATLGVAAGSTNVGSIGPQAFYAPTPVLITANGGNFTAGAVRIAIQYMLPKAPTA